MNLVRQYTRWLHTQWPAGTVEKLPVVRADGSTSVPGLYVVGDLTGIPLLKFSSDTGARAIRTLLDDPRFKHRATDGGVEDLVIIGGGVSGMAAALAARTAGLQFTVLEASEPFSTIVNFPKGKPIYTYPTDMTPAGELQFTATVKEPLVEELRAQTLQRGITAVQARAERVARQGPHLVVHLADGKTVTAHRVIVAIGRSGNFRKLGVPGEDLDKVTNRLHDPADFCGRKILVVGGGDSALEAAIALATCGSQVTLSYRKPAFSRPKPDNVERLRALADDGAPRGGIAGAQSTGSIRLALGSTVQSIDADSVHLRTPQGDTRLPNDAVFTLIGREAPLDFFRRSGVPIRGEWRATTWISCIAFVLFCVFLYHWKGDSGLPVKAWFKARNWFPFNIGNPADPTTLFGTVRLSMQVPSFYYSLAYCLCVVGFGVARIRRRRTPYVRAQTLTLMAIQCVPLFLLPYILLPWMGHNGVFGERHRVTPLAPEVLAPWRQAAATREPGALSYSLVQDLPAVVTWAAGVVPLVETDGHGRVTLRTADGAREVVLRLDEGRLHERDNSAPTSALADALFPATEWSLHGREFWRSVGFVLAWPLLPWNFFTDQPLWGWLAIGAVQTFVLIPLLVWKWGKGAYCGWICSCGALAETLGDAHREKMPHGPLWNRLNMIGQVFLGAALILLVLRIIAWVVPGPDAAERWFKLLFEGKSVHGGAIGGIMAFANYAWFVDLLWAGILGVCFYFWFSGRVWCRFACPLAALMHIYARFSRFRIAADKKKCISCNVCTTVCHQGIDVMNFANKGQHMADPECVRCSACVQSCPTGVLEFVQINVATGAVTHRDRLAASPVRQAETHVR